MKVYKSSVSVRGDSLYCPLPLSIDSYWNCLINCHHCYFRSLNHVWGDDLRPADPLRIEKKLRNGLKNKKPQTPLAYALYHKKTIRLGNKTDPFQPAEREHRVTQGVLQILNRLEWTYVIQTRCTDMMAEYHEELMTSRDKNLITLLPVISPGLDRDWEVLERKRTTKPSKRLRTARKYKKKGIPVGINGEPFIPGYHTVKDFEQVLLLLKKYGIKSYNTYNFHFNAFVAKKLNAIGVDIEKIWYHNRDKYWKPILRQLMDLSIKHDIVLGCPDFVNTGSSWKEKANTCCGIDVPNPCTFNTHYFKRGIQENLSPEVNLQSHNDGTGNYEQAEQIVKGKKCDFYTLKDAGFR